MRFDDMIATALAQPAGRDPERDAKWRQLVDLLAQRRERGDSALIDRAFGYLRSHRGAVPVEARRRSAHALAGLRIDPLLLRFFAEDHPTVAAPLFRAVRLSAGEWLRLLPSLGPTARSLLRHRRDLPGDVVQALASFGSSDFVLGSGEGAARAAPLPPAPTLAGDGEAQIRELVARIEAFRKQRARDPLRLPETEAAAAPPADTFRWETGAEGIILWVDGAPRGPLVGQTIAAMAARGQHGVDGQAAGAFAKRAPFRDARLRAAGDGPAAGDWRISGVPFFDPALGSFLGYRGSARRPRLDEIAEAAAGEPGEGLFGTNVPPESLRQLIHELRTPLNAILGFAEMIDGQYMGPADAASRDRAGQIIEQARRLLAAVDDLDTAARIETSGLDLGEGAADAVALLCRLHDAYEKVAAGRDAHIRVEIERDLPPAAVDAEAAERMFARLLAATIGLAGEGETIGATMRMETLGAGRMLCLSIDRPRAAVGREEAELLDPGYSPEGDWPGAPALGLGFALRLVRNLAEATGGVLLIGERRFSLYLPPLLPAERSSGQGGEGTG